MVADAGADRLDVGQGPHDRIAQPHVLLDDRVLLGGQRARLAQDAVRDRDLAHIVEQPGQLHRATLLGSEADQVGQEDRVPRDVLRVALGVAILGVHGEHQPGQDVEAGTLRGGQLVGGQVGDPDAIAPAGLGFGQRAGGHRQQLGRGLAVGRRVADAAAHGDRQPLGATELETEGVDPGAQPGDGRLEVVDAGRRGQDQELVGAEPADRRRLGQLGREDRRDLDQGRSPAAWP